MKLGKRIIPTIAIAFFLVPTLFADDTPKPGDTPKKGESAGPTTAPATAAKPAEKTPLALPASSPAQAYAGKGTGKRSERHSRGAGAQSDSTPKVELFLGYSYWRSVPDSTRNRIDGMNGGSTSLAYNFNSHIGLVADFAGFGVDSLEFSRPGAGRIERGSK